MGRGNICTRGKYEGLYYVDSNYINYWYKDGEVELQENIEDLTEWDFDSDFSYLRFNNFLEEFAESFKKKFPSFEIVQTEACGVILENNLFTVEIEDNEWGYAVELIQKEADYDEPSKEGLQKKHYKTYLEGMKNSLFEQFPSLGVYAGAWTHGIINRAA